MHRRCNCNPIRLVRSYYSGERSPDPDPSPRQSPYNGTGNVNTRAAVSTPTVLVVDDDPQVVDVISEKLREAGYAVRQAGSATEATTFYERQRPDLVVLDLMLPDADGLILCARLSANASVPI